MNNLVRFQHDRLFQYFSKALSTIIFILTIVILFFSLGSLKKKGV